MQVLTASYATYCPYLLEHEAQKSHYDEPALWNRHSWGLMAVQYQSDGGAATTNSKIPDLQPRPLCLISEHYHPRGGNCSDEVFDSGHVSQCPID